MSGRRFTFIPLPNPPVGAPEIEPLNEHQAAILGIPIEFHSNSALPADSRGMFWRRRIVVGPNWLKLDRRTQRAVLLHEAWHVQRFHREQRTLMLFALALPTLWLAPWSVIGAVALTLAIYAGVEWLAQRQELDADRFAAQHGFGNDLLAYVKRNGPPPTLPTFYPDFEDRCEALEKAIKEKTNAALAS